MELYLFIGIIWAIISIYASYRIYDAFKTFKKTEIVFSILLGGFICVFLWPILMITNVIDYIKHIKNRKR